MDELFAHGPWLRRLASSLARGDAEADDLVQETWMAALRSPPSTDRPVQPWLRTVLQNAFRMQARASSRRLAREVALLPEGDGVPPDDLVERLETLALVTRLVGDLDEALRRTVYLRYYEGLSAADIARKENIPAGTVRSRLKTALDRLRVALDQQNGGDRRRWALLFAPLPGVTVMKKNTIAAAVVAVLVVAGATTLFEVRHAHDDTAPNHVASAPSSSVPSSSRAAAADATRSTPSSEAPAGVPVKLVRAHAARDPSLAAGAVGGHVVDWGSGHGVDAAEVTFAHDGVSFSIKSDATGAFAFAPQQPGEYRLAVVMAPGYLPFAPEWDESPIHIAAKRGVRVDDVAIYLVPALDYQGVVVDQRGAPVGQANVRLLGAAAGDQALHPIVDTFTSGDDGTFHFHAPDNAVLVAHKDHVGTGRASMSGGALAMHRLVIKLDDGAHLASSRIAGRVVGPDGVALPGARVFATPERTPEKDDRTAASGEAVARDDGRFVVEGLDPIAYHVRATFEGDAPAMVKTNAPNDDVVLKLGAGAAIAGKVADVAGHPIVAFTVTVTAPKGLREEQIETRSVIDADGAFTIRDVAPGDYHVAVSAHGYAPSSAQAATASTTPDPIVVTLTDGGTLTGQVVDAATRAPLAFAKVSVESMSGTTPVASGDVAITGDDGRFEIDGIAAGSRSIFVGAGEHHGRIVSALAIVDGATTGPLEVALPAVKPGDDAKVELVGIGAKLSPSDDALVVNFVFPDSGAAQAGLAVGDGIVAVDGAPVATLGMGGAIERIRGPEGTVVTLSVRRAGSASTAEMPVTRKKISS